MLYFAPMNAQSFGGVSPANSYHVQIINLVLNSLDFTHLITEYQDSTRSGLLESTRKQNEHCKAWAARTSRSSW